MKNIAKVKLYRRIYYFLIGALVLAIVTSVAYWYWMDEISIKTLIVDKTVPYDDYREHKGLMWLLNHKKMINEDTGEYFRYSKDYFGYHPEEDNKIKEYVASPEDLDLIYLVDTYGVYLDDYSNKEVRGDKSKKIYGGIDISEINEVRSSLKNGVTLIGEFNIFGLPTNRYFRPYIEHMFGVKWRGWIGRYYKESARRLEVPEAIVELYEQKYKREWEYTGPLIVLLSEGNDIIILEQGEDFKGEKVCFVVNNEYQDMFDGLDYIRYYYWFDIVEYEDESEELAYFFIDLTEEGKEKFRQIGIPNHIPAVIRNEYATHKAYYFAGDFADSNILGTMWNIAGLEYFNRIFSLDIDGDLESFFWRAYYPLMDNILEDVKKNRTKRIEEENIEEENIFYEDGVKMVCRTKGSIFEVYRDGEWRDFIVKGINIGTAMPGYWYTNFIDDEKIYLDWFEQIHSYNANCIRVYTLMDPTFYRAFYNYNEAHKDNPLYLFQEIWPEEIIPDHNYLDTGYQEEYEKEIRYLIDSIHGNIEIPERKGRAYGKYYQDVSKYVVGYLIGRELEPDEVLTTDEMNEGYIFEGNYLYTKEGSTATEGWLALNCDYALQYEEDMYGWQHPSSIVSWPTLDPIEHDSEWNEWGDKSKQFNDKAVVDINNIEMKHKLKAGFFGSYHIYPNYPDFMNNEESYAEYHDEEGEFRYGGYLKEFMVAHKKYPAVVAEFGIANGVGIAHYNPNGLHHGGLSELDQGKMTVRMMEAILEEGYAGGIIFEWMDEWAKKTWTTEPFMISYENHVFWHNAIDPEQNYGVLSYDVFRKKEFDRTYRGDDLIKSAVVGHDEMYLYLDINLREKKDFNDYRVYIGIDTIDPKRGDHLFNDESKTECESGNEFMMNIECGENANLLVHPSYDRNDMGYMTKETYKGEYSLNRTLVNKKIITKNGTEIPALYEDSGSMLIDDFTNHQATVEIDKNKMKIRFPWNRLNFTDPTTMQVLEDPDNRSPLLLRDELKTTKSDGVVFNILIKSENRDYCFSTYDGSKDSRYVWDNWGMPICKTRLKDSYEVLRDYFSSLD